MFLWLFVPVMVQDGYIKRTRHKNPRVDRDLFHRNLKVLFSKNAKVVALGGSSINQIKNVF